MKEKSTSNYNDLNETLKNIFTPEAFYELSEEAKNIFLNAKEVENSADWPFNYTIDEVQYAIYTNNEADRILKEDVDNLFEDLIYEVPRHWRNYINKEEWIEENMEESFKRWFSNYYDFKDLSSVYSNYYIFKEDV